MEKKRKQSFSNKIKAKIIKKKKKTCHIADACINAESWARGST